MVPIIEQDSILLLGYSILYKEYTLTRFNHPFVSTTKIHRNTLIPDSCVFTCICCVFQLQARLGTV